jgi:hypothetical protein
MYVEASVVLGWIPGGEYSSLDPESCDEELIHDWCSQLFMLGTSSASMSDLRTLWTERRGMERRRGRIRGMEEGNVRLGGGEGPIGRKGYPTMDGMDLGRGE